MTKSRMAGLALLAFALSAEAFEPITAEQAIDNYRRTFPTTEQLDCPQSVGPEVVICGRRDKNENRRLPLPVEDPGRHLPGEPPSTADLLTLDAKEECVSDKGCAGANTPMMAVVAIAIEIAISLIDPDRRSLSCCAVPGSA